MTPRPAPSRPWLRPLLLLVIVLELVGASALVRSELFAREPITRALSRLGERLGGHFVLGSVSARGLTGLELDDLLFEPRDSGLPSIRIARVLIYPRLDRLVFGELAFDEVIVDGLEFRADRANLLALRDRLAAERARPQGPSGGGNASRLPDEIRLRAAEIELVDDQLATGSLVIGFPDLRVAFESAEGGRAVRLEGDVVLADRTRGHLRVHLGGAAPQARLDFEEPTDWLALLAPDERVPVGLRLRSRSLVLASSHELVLEDVALEGLSEELPVLSDWQLTALNAAELHLQRAPERLALTLVSGTAELRNDTHSAHVSLAHAEVWTDPDQLDPRAVVTLGGPGRGTLELRVERDPDAQTWSLTAAAHDYRVDELAPLMSEASPVHVPSGRFSGVLTAAAGAEPQSVTITLDGTLEDGVAAAPFVAARPMENVTIGLGGQVSFDGARRHLAWREGRLLLAGVPLLFAAELSWNEESPRLWLQAHLDDVDASQLRRGLPAGLAPSLERVTLAGTLSATIEVDLDAARPEEAELNLELDASRLVIVDFGPDVPVATLDADFALAIPTADGIGRVVGPATASWVTYDEVSELLVPALICAEDGRFFSHDGFDWRAIEASVELNLRERRIVRGGSTISQQVVRSLFLGSERTLGRKFEEAFLTWQLEQYVPKRRIMELYVNAVHWGPGVYGVSEAAATYFHRRPTDLTVGEAAFLASILPNPDYFGTQYARRLVTPSRREKVCNILRNMRNSGVITEPVATRTCRDAERGIVSVVPPPEWLVEPTPPSLPADLPIAAARPPTDLALVSSW